MNLEPLLKPLFRATIFLVLMSQQNCFSRIQASIRAEITLRNYRDHPGLKISADEWKRSFLIYESVLKKAKGEQKKRIHARKLFCEAKVAQLQGETDRAMDLFLQSSNIDPSWAYPYQAAGTVLMEKGDFEKACKMLEKAIQLDPLWVNAIGDLGVAYYHLNEHLKALEYFDMAISVDPSQAHIHSNRGNILSSLARYDEAIAAHMKALSLEPLNPVFYWNLAATLEEIKDFKNLLWVYNKLKDLLPQHQKLFVLLKIAGIFEEMGQDEEALAELKKALAIEPENNVVITSLKKFYYERKLYAELIKLIDETSRIGCGECAKECYNLGNKLLTEGNMDGAKRAFEIAIRLSPEWTDPVMNLGVAYYQTHNYKKAIDLFLKVLSANSNESLPVINIAMAYYKMNRVDEALKWLGKAPETDENAGFYYSIMGEILRFQQNFKESEQAHIRATEMAPYDCSIISRYAKLLIDMKKSKKAKSMLLNIKKPECIGYHISMAEVLIDENKLDEAMEEAEKASNMDKTSAEAKALKGLILFKKGEIEKARENIMSAVCMEQRIAKEKMYEKAILKLKIPADCNP